MKQLKQCDIDFLVLQNGKHFRFEIKSAYKYVISSYKKP